MRLAAFLLLATILLAGCNGGTVDLHALTALLEEAVWLDPNHALGWTCVARPITGSESRNARLPIWNERRG